MTDVLLNFTIIDCLGIASYIFMCNLIYEGLHRKSDSRVKKIAVNVTLVMLIINALLIPCLKLHPLHSIWMWPLVMFVGGPVFMTIVSHMILRKQVKEWLAEKKSRERD